MQRLLADVERNASRSLVASSYVNSIRSAIAMTRNGAALKEETIRSWVPQRQSLHGTPRSAGYTYAFENYMRAELLAAPGRDDEALAWYDSFGNDFGYDVAFFAPASLRRARILEQRGRKQEAAHEYDRFLSLWSEADPELQSQVAEARNRRKMLDGERLAGRNP
ncbi:MAG: hypothetical protein ABIS27_00025 [Longimicrobiales bacterium]